MSDVQRLSAEQTALIDAAPDAMVLVSEAGVILFGNLQAERLFGYERWRLDGRPINDLVPERLRAPHDLLHRDYSKDPRPRRMGSGLNIVALRADGSEFPVEISLSSVAVPGFSNITMAAIRDVSGAQGQRAADKREYVADARERLANARDRTADSRERGGNAHDRGAGAGVDPTQGRDAAQARRDAQPAERARGQARRDAQAADRADGRMSNASEGDIRHPAEASVRELIADTRDSEADTRESIADTREAEEDIREARSGVREVELSLRESVASGLHVDAEEKLAAAFEDSLEYQRAVKHYRDIVRHRIANPLQIVKGMAITLVSDASMGRQQVQMLDAIIEAAYRLEQATLFDPVPQSAVERVLHPKPFE